jgi:hypothetical protein
MAEASLINEQIESILGLRPSVCGIVRYHIYDDKCLLPDKKITNKRIIKITNGKLEIKYKYYIDGCHWDMWNEIPDIDIYRIAYINYGLDRIRSYYLRKVDNQSALISNRIQPVIDMLSIFIPSDLILEVFSFLKIDFHYFKVGKIY